MEYKKKNNFVYTAAGKSKYRILLLQPGKLWKGAQASVHGERAAIRQETQSNALIHAGLRISRLIFCATFSPQCTEDRNKLRPYQSNRM